MPTRPCLDCGKLTTATRCAICTSARDSTRNARRTWYHGDWQRTSKQARDAWVNQHGWTCPGIGRPPHPATNLTVDHTTGLVLCLKCNIAAGPAGH